MLATWTMYGSEKITSELAWRIPLWLQLLCAGLLMVTCLWCPETPRWVWLGLFFTVMFELSNIIWIARFQ